MGGVKQEVSASTQSNIEKKIFVLFPYVKHSRRDTHGENQREYNTLANFIIVTCVHPLREAKNVF